MKLAQAFASLDAPPSPQSDDARLERRRHTRVKLALPGRYLAPDGGEHECVTIDVAAQGVRVKAQRPPAPSARVVVYLQELGRVEGVVVRTMSDGFAFVIAGTPRKIERIIDRIGWLLRKDAARAPERRLLPRLELDGSIVVMLRRDRQEQPVELLDISATGVAFRTRLPLLIGDRIAIGTRNATVARVFAGGAAANFT